MTRPRRLVSLLALASVLAAPASAFAHEHQSFRIGDKVYDFTVGSINEPVAVDDKSGVEFSVGLANGHAEDAGHVDGDEHEAATPVTGLEKTLKVELKAAGKRKELPVTAVYGEPGSYKAVFIPTVATTLTYRIFGTIGGVPVDLEFTCNPAGHPATPEDDEELMLDENVFRVARSGSFGCPAAKADLGFPEPSAAIVDIASGTAGSDGGSASGATALALSVVALAFSVIGFARSRRTA